MSFLHEHKWKLLIVLIIIIIAVFMFFVPWDTILYATSTVVTFVFVALVGVVIILVFLGITGHDIKELRGR